MHHATLMIIFLWTVSDIMFYSLNVHKPMSPVITMPNILKSIAMTWKHWFLVLASNRALEVLSIYPAGFLYLQETRQWTAKSVISSGQHRSGRFDWRLWLRRILSSSPQEHTQSSNTACPRTSPLIEQGTPLIPNTHRHTISNMQANEEKYKGKTCRLLNVKRDSHSPSASLVPLSWAQTHSSTLHFPSRRSSLGCYSLYSNCLWPRCIAGETFWHPSLTQSG